MPGVIILFIANSISTLGRIGKTRKGIRIVEHKARSFPYFLFSSCSVHIHAHVCSQLIKYI
jgi:hypothetical protein